MFKLLPDESGDGGVRSTLQHIQHSFHNTALRLKTGQCSKKLLGYLFQDTHNMYILVTGQGNAQ